LHRSRWLPSDLSRWEYLGLAAGLLVVLVFGGIVELRSVFLKRRMTDLQVFARAGWAVRSGEDIYTCTDENGWHYHYPPLFAILMTPLGSPPAESPHGLVVPFAVTVAFWYLFSLLCLAIAVHTLASAVEATIGFRREVSPDRECRRWWSLRLLPVLICLPTIGQTLARGQVSLLLLALVCAMMAALLRGHNGRAGIWLAAAICLKVIPAYLLLYPIWRRNGRCLIGCALGLVIGLAVIPAVTMGPARTFSYFQEWTEVLLRPAMGSGTDQSRSVELLDMTGDSQSLQAILHNWQYPDRDTRPKKVEPTTRQAHWLLAGALTLVTLLAGSRRPDYPLREVFFLGALLLIMLYASPVCHMHYFCLSIPLVLGLIAADRERLPLPLRGKTLQRLLAVNALFTFLPTLPGTPYLRDFGLSGSAGLLLWLTAVWALGVTTRWKREPGATETRVTSMAA
jgi:hypothetical protein